MNDKEERNKLQKTACHLIFIQINTLVQWPQDLHVCTRLNLYSQFQVAKTR